MSKKTVVIEAETLADAERIARKQWGYQVSRVAEVTDVQEKEA